MQRKRVVSKGDELCTDTENIYLGSVARRTGRMVDLKRPDQLLQY